MSIVLYSASFRGRGYIWAAIDLFRLNLKNCPVVFSLVIADMLSQSLGSLFCVRETLLLIWPIADWDFIMGG